MIFDLDPSENAISDLRGPARDVGELLRELGLEPFAMATGSRGYHVVVPLQRRMGFDDVRRFARDVTRIAVARDASLTLEQRKAARRERTLVDVMRNTYGHTAVAPYSVRARPEAPVATPLRWDELSQPSTRPDRWTLRTIPQRLEDDGDAWADIRSRARAIGPARRRLDRMLEELGPGHPRQPRGAS
jgi:bifunctional non-homologous end joining protein LigD